MLTTARLAGEVRFDAASSPHHRDISHSELPHASPIAPCASPAAASGKRTSAVAFAARTSGFATATAPAFVGTAMVVCRDFAAAYLQVHFTNSHGGLTPAALVNVRFCIAKGVIFRKTNTVHCTRSGGRKPPVVPLHANATATSTHYRGCCG
jgi:hypothetical protein